MAIKNAKTSGCKELRDEESFLAHHSAPLYLRSALLSSKQRNMTKTRILMQVNCSLCDLIFAPIVSRKLLYYCCYFIVSLRIGPPSLMIDFSHIPYIQHPVFERIFVNYIDFLKAQDHISFYKQTKNGMVRLCCVC